MKKASAEYRVGAIDIAGLKSRAPAEGMMVVVNERIDGQAKKYGKTRQIRGRVMAVNDRIFTLETDGFERIESFHLSDLVTGKLEVRVADHSEKGAANDHKPEN